MNRPMAVTLALALPALSAQQRLNTIEWTDADTISIRLAVDAPEACYGPGPATEGAPQGSPAVRDAVLLTLTLYRGPGLCAQVVSNVTFTTTAKVPGGARAVIVYVVNSTTKTTEMRALALPPRPDRFPDATLPIEGTTWILTNVGGRAVGFSDVAKPATLRLIGNARRFTGSAGCNGMSGTYTLEGTAIRFTAPAMTRMACARGMEIERIYSDILPAVRSWRIEGRTLELLIEGGKVAARFDAQKG